MTATAIALPFQFAVIGKPISHQSKDSAAKQRWKAHVRKTAVVAVGDRSPFGDMCALTITHFYDAPEDNESGVPDTSNIWKLTEDALTGVLFVDDYQVTDFTVKRRSLNKHFRVRGIRKELAIALSEGVEFVYILVDHPPDHADLC